jgi:ribosomal protein L17
VSARITSLFAHREVSAGRKKHPLGAQVLNPVPERTAQREAGGYRRLMRLEESAEVLAPASGFSVNLAFIGNHLVTSSAGI